MKHEADDITISGWRVTRRAYQVSNNVDRSLELAATYRVKSNEEVLSHAAAPDLSREVYTDGHQVVCIDQDGSLLWNYNLEPRYTQRCIKTPKFLFSLDSAWMWVYRPDAMTDRGPDKLVLLRADNGEEAAQVELDSVGEGGHLVLHPDGRHILLDVGEGQDSVQLYRAAPTGEDIDLHSYGWDDRCLVDVAPDGWWFMTVDHGRYDIAFHVFPSGEVVLQVPIEGFSHEYFGDDNAGMDWNGGFLDADIAVVLILGQKDDKEWHRHYGIYLHSGIPFGRFEAYSRDKYDFEPLGDSTWIVSGPDGSAVRRWSPGQSEVFRT